MRVKKVFIILLMFIVMLMFSFPVAAADLSPPGDSTVELIIMPDLSVSVGMPQVNIISEYNAVLLESSLSTDLVYILLNGVGLIEDNSNYSINGPGTKSFRNSDFKILRRFEHPAVIGIV